MEKKSKRQKKQCAEILSNDDQSRWSDLSVELQRQVSERISYGDFLRFRAVCKNWHNASLHKDYLQRRALFILNWINNKNAQFVDLLTQETSPLMISTPVRTKSDFLCSNSGWLLFLIKEASKLVFCDPYSKATVAVILPDTIRDSEKSEVKLAAFSTAPTSPDCVIFIFWKMLKYNHRYKKVKEDFVITTYRQKNQRWYIKFPFSSKWEFVERSTIEFVDRAIAYLDGKFYCAIDRNSWIVLGSFDVELQEWVIMESTTSPALRLCPLLKTEAEIYSTYLVESDGELLLALPREQFKNGYCRRHIYRFDLSQNNWTRVQNLGNRVLILGRFSSFATPAEGVTRRFANKIIISNDAWSVCYYWELSEGEWYARKTLNL